MPSLYEGFGIPVIEAFGCGCSVIVSDASSLPEIVGDAGMLFYPDSSQNLLAVMEKVLNDVKYREGLIQKGLNRAKDFNWDSCTTIITQTIEKCIKK